MIFIFYKKKEDNTDKSAKKKTTLLYENISLNNQANESLAKSKNINKKEDDENSLSQPSKKNINEKLNKLNGNIDDISNFSNKNYNFNFSTSKNQSNVNNQSQNNKTTVVDNNGNITHFYAIQNINCNPNNLIKGKSFIKKYAFTSLAGKTDSGAAKTNQDNFVIMENILNLEEYRIYGIFDGHGINR